MAAMAMEPEMARHGDVEIPFDLSASLGWVRNTWNNKVKSLEPEGQAGSAGVEPGE